MLNFWTAISRVASPVRNIRGDDSPTRLWLMFVRVCPQLTNERDAPPSSRLLSVPFTGCHLGVPFTAPMPPRRSARFCSTSQSGSSSTADASPFSKPSMPTTPASEMDVDPPKPLPSTATSSKRRAVESDSDDSLKAKPTKRRATAKQVYVQVPTSKTIGGRKVYFVRKRCISLVASFPPPFRRFSAPKGEDVLYPDLCRHLVPT